MTIKIALIGAGSRGKDSYAPFTKTYPELAQIVAVAEPRDWWREDCAKTYDINPEFVFKDWKELLSKPKLADAVIIATQDKDHLEPTLLACQKGYDILLEKPMATTEKDCREIVEAVKKNNVILSVCHVLRYTPYYRKIKEIVDSGLLGEIVTVRHFEQIGFWHYAHSYVRGNWANLEKSSPMILAKACHDLDILGFILSAKCKKLSSFGGLKHFTKNNKPKGASDNCIDCKVTDCPYSAVDFYLGRLRSKRTGWPLNIITSELTEKGVLSALKTGPYGRCVYNCDNDVADHQVVNIEYENGITATFTVTAFTFEENRRTEIFGSLAELRGNGTTLQLTNFKTGQKQEFDYSDLAEGAESGHMGGDFGIMHDFIQAIKNRKDVLSNAEQSLMSHLMAFAAEESRRNNQIITIKI